MANGYLVKDVISKHEPKGLKEKVVEFGQLVDQNVNN